MKMKTYLIIVKEYILKLKLKRNQTEIYILLFIFILFVSLNVSVFWLNELKKWKQHSFVLL